MVYDFDNLRMRQGFWYDAQYMVAILHVNTPALYGGMLIQYGMQQLFALMAADVCFKQQDMIKI